MFKFHWDDQPKVLTTPEQTKENSHQGKNKQLRH